MASSRYLDCCHGEPLNSSQGMCKNIVEKGDLTSPLLVFNRTQKRSTDLAHVLGSKVTVTSTIEDAVSKSDIIFTCVGDDRAMKETIDTALKVDIKGKLFVDCSTVHPDTTEELAKKINFGGGEFVACPVFGAPAMAEAGQLICILAGPMEAVEKVKPYTKGVMGRAVIDYGGKPYGMFLNFLGLELPFKMCLPLDVLSLFDKMYSGDSTTLSYFLIVVRKGVMLTQIC
jgi:3-hydroxyisobutyrate dehydrogenase-like beta-hydroxyacid dehydrogenase